MSSVQVVMEITVVKAGADHLSSVSAQAINS